MEQSPELPQDILRHIFAALEVPDLARAACVCSSWRSLYTRICSGSLKQQTPCLLYTSASAGDKAACLYSLAEKKAYKLILPDPPIRTRNVIGSSYGWIVTADERSELHIVNPITGDQVALPSVTTIEQVKPIYDDAGAVHRYEYSWYTGERNVAGSPSVFVPSQLRDYLFYKAFLSSDPSAGDYSVALIHNPHAQISFAKAGDDKWTWLPPHSHYVDCLFKDGLLYASTEWGEIHAFDLGAPAVTPNIVMGKAKDYLRERIYIVEGSCGGLLQIWRSDIPPGGDDYDPFADSESDSDLELDPESQVHNTLMIKIYKVEITARKLVEISSLDETLFLGHNLSLCLHAEEHPQLKANHVYFTDEYDVYLFAYKNNRRDVGVFDLENNSSEEVVSPQLWSNWPSPVWLVPNPRKMKPNLDT